MPKPPPRLPKYVYRQKVGGMTYYRFRRGGSVHRLPGVPGTADFHARYAELLRAWAGDNEKSRGRYKPGSVAELINKYMDSPEWHGLEASTQRDYKRYLYRLDNSIGAEQARSIDQGYVATLLDTMKDKRGLSNHTLSVIRTVFRWGMAPGRGLVVKDPTAGFEKLSGNVESHRRWPEEQITKFLDSEGVGATMKLALLLGVYTGQRISDVAGATWAGYDGEWLKVVQRKTKTELMIPVHPDLREALDEVERRGATILTTRTGKPYRDRVMFADFHEAREAAGIDTDLTFHGLRHRTGSALAEAGATAPQIQSILGHRSLQSVMVYIKQAQQKIHAAQAMSLLPSAKRAAKRFVSA